MSNEFESKVLEKLELLNKKIDRLDEKIDGANENFNRKIDYVDNKQTEKTDSLNAKIDYLTNNVAKILQEQIKLREEIARDRKKQQRT